MNSVKIAKVRHSTVNTGYKQIFLTFLETFYQENAQKVFFLLAI